MYKPPLPTAALLLLGGCVCSGAPHTHGESAAPAAFAALSVPGAPPACRAARSGLGRAGSGLVSAAKKKSREESSAPPAVADLPRGAARPKLVVFDLGVHSW
jgi:hypothetical protein